MSISLNDGLLICIAVALLLLFLYINYKGKRLNGQKLVEDAVANSAFNPTIFKIYDKSTSSTCDRLIEVRPFNWYIWACGGEVFILNPEGVMKCSMNSTPVVQVHVNQTFTNTCISMPLQSILNEYRKIPAVDIPYEIVGNKFTILSALNILVKNYIKLENTAGPLMYENIIVADQSDMRSNDGNSVSERELILRTGGSHANRKSVQYLAREYARHVASRVV